MAAIVLRRRFTIFLTICCISLIIITLYARKHNERTPKNEIMTYVYESFVPSDQDQNFNEKKFAVVKQITDDTIIRHPQIVTQHREPTEIPNLEFSVKFESERIIEGYSDEYEYAVVDSQEVVKLEEGKIKSLLEKMSHLQKKAAFSSEYKKMPFRMYMRNHPEINSNRRIEKSTSKIKKEPTPYDVNYSIEKYEDCNKCTGYIDVTTMNVTEKMPPKNPSLIIDTTGCKIPKLDPWDPTVKHLIEDWGSAVCPGPPLFMRPSPDGSISLNETILKDYYNMTVDELICNYQAIYRQHEDPMKSKKEVSFTIGNVTKLQFGLPLNEDYVGVGCKVKSQTTNFEQFFPLIRLKKEIEEERNARIPPTPKLNIILAGIDSVSKLNFLRHFKKTLTYLKEKIYPFEMNGYTKVGDNTFPNLVPLLTGRFVEYYYNESLKNTMYFDDLDFIWKDYAKRGYRTFYAEDNPLAGTFNYLKKGFYDPPTDYYFRPAALVVESSAFKQEKKDPPCLNSQLETDFLYDYFRDFVKAMGQRPYFGFTMVSTLTHDLLNLASWADEPTVNLLEDLSNMGAFNSSLLVLFSDHGIRFGRIRYTYVGKYEERMPFMYIHAPKWFLDQHPELARHLKINQDRLMTLFDVHATMVHLLDLNKTQKERSSFSLGTSLFDEIPDNRTCDDAHIKHHWCPCATYEVVPKNATKVLNASHAIVNDINSQLELHDDICEVLEVDEIMNAMVGKANEIVLRYVRAENEVLNKRVILGKRIEPISDYMITLVTRPGGAVFEATVRHDPTFDSYTVLGISRISLYGMTSWCVDSQKLKLFCFCKVQKEQ